MNDALALVDATLVDAYGHALADDSTTMHLQKVLTTYGTYKHERHLCFVCTSCTIGFFYASYQYQFYDNEA